MQCVIDEPTVLPIAIRGVIHGRNSVACRPPVQPATVGPLPNCQVTFVTSLPAPYHSGLALAASQVAVLLIPLQQPLPREIPADAQRQGLGHSGEFNARQCCYPAESQGSFRTVDMHPVEKQLCKCMLRLRALPKRWIRMTAPLWAVVRGNSTGSAARATTMLNAAECDQAHDMATPAAHPQVAMLEAAALEEVLDLLLDIP
jgi:hypothetical protein